MQRPQTETKRNEVKSNFAHEPSTTLDKQMSNLQEQMKALADIVENSIELISHLQNDLKIIEEEPSSFRTAVANVPTGKTVTSFTVPWATLGLRICEIP